MKLETPADAQRFRARVINACIRAHAQGAPLRPEQLKVAIIGAGATGAELAAELQRFGPELMDLAMRDPEGFQRALQPPRAGALQVADTVEPRASRALAARMTGTP